jgi:AcrR family transcriptional regulator
MLSHLKVHDSFSTLHGTPLGRGRPASHASRNVAEDIINAAIVCLANKSAQQITIKEIASLAGTRPAMVYYYFGSMEGLLTEIVRHGLKEVLDDTCKMREAIRRNEVTNPLRSMISMFAEAYNQRQVLTRILISEIIREDSQIRSFFVKQWPAHGKLMMDDVIGQLSASGYYRKDIDIEGVCAMIRSVIFYPLIIKPYLAREGESIEHYLDDKWIDFVTTVFECYLRPQNFIPACIPVTCVITTTDRCNIPPIPSGQHATTLASDAPSSNQTPS